MKYINLGGNKIKHLKLSSLQKLNTLYLHKNNLENIELSDLPNLRYLNLSGNKLKSLDVNDLKYMNILLCDDNNIKTLNIRGLKHLHRLNYDKDKVNSQDMYNQIIELKNLVRINYDSVTSFNRESFLAELKIDIVEKFLKK